MERAATSTTCAACSTPLPAAARFCAQCGAAVPGPSQSTAAPPADRPLRDDDSFASLGVSGQSTATSDDARWSASRQSVEQQTAGERGATMGDADRLLTYLVLGGAAALVFGSFLPWVEASAPLVGTIKRSEVGGGDGLITIVSGAAAAFVGLDLYRTGRRSALLKWLPIPGLVAAVIVVIDFFDIQNRIDEANQSDLVVASYGSGLYLVAAGTIAVLLGAYLLMRRRLEEARGSAPPFADVIRAFWQDITADVIRS